MVNDDEIVTSVQEKSDPVDDETDDGEDNNNDESSKDPSNIDAFSAFNSHIVSGFIYCMDRIRFSVIRTITYPNGVPSQLIRINDVLLHNS
ncbi:hypothetical protein TNCV_2064951 [Trichonephila clavipes]|nr:hypothetical protein TNCV_2064951 [Trichonephila clavipes]